MFDSLKQLPYYTSAEGEDYTFNVLSKNEIYKISDIRDGDPYVLWTETERCSSGSTQTEFKPQLLNLNGQPVNAFYLNGSFLACLIR